MYLSIFLVALDRVIMVMVLLAIAVGWRSIKPDKQADAEKGLAKQNSGDRNKGPMTDKEEVELEIKPWSQGWPFGVRRFVRALLLKTQ